MDPNAWEAAATPPAGATPPAAQPSSPAQPANSAQPPSPAQAALTAGQNPDRSQASTTSPTDNAAIGGPAPMVLRPAKTGLAGIISKIADTLAGTTTPELYTNDQGEKFVYHPEMTRGQQWERIAGEAVAGAAHGLAAGKGAGNMGKAAAAGVDTGMEMADKRQQQGKEMTAEARQSMLDNANNQMLRMKMAEESWKATRLKTEAGQHDLEFAQNQEDRLTKEGGRVIGTAAHPGDIAGILKVQPDLMKQMVNNHTVELVPHYNADGTPGGVRVVMMPGDYRKQVAPAGSKFPTFNQVSGDYDWHNASDPLTQGELDDYWTAAGAAKQKFANDKNEQALKQQQTHEAQVNADTKTQETPSVIAKNRAETEKDQAEAQKDRALFGAGGPGASNLVDMIGTGRMPPGRLSYLMARNPELLSAVSAKYPDFDGSKIDSYATTYKDFTSGKVSNQLNAGATALGHLKELKALNTAMSHIPHTAAWTAYQNKADTLATELASFYGDSTIPAIAQIKDTLASTLPGNRNAAIKTQSQSMSDKFDSFEQQWKDAAPSKTYEAQMPQMSDQAKDARAELDPNYKKRRIAELTNNPQAAAAVKITPGEPTIQYPDGSTGVVRNGQWVKAQQ
jgi:hypothetical protein